MTTMTMNKKIVGGVVGGLLSLSGCTQLEPIDEQGGGAGGTPAAVQEVLTARCGIAGCHDGTTPPFLAGSSNLVDVASTVGIPYVELGNIQNSYLAIKMADIPGAMPRTGTIMPPSNDMPPEEIALVFGWIAGAPFPDAGTGGGGDDGIGDGGMTGDDGMPGDDDDGGDDGMDVEVPPTPADVQEVFTNYCATSGACHAGGFAPDLTEGSIVDGVSPAAGIPYIDPGNVANSYLAIKMTDVPDATAMRIGQAMPPPGSPEPSADEIQLVLDWIAEAAPEGGGTGTGGMDMGGSDTGG